MQDVGRTRTVQEIRPGGWIDVPGRGTGRVSCVTWTPGTVVVHVTLEDGWAFTFTLGETVRYWES